MMLKQLACLLLWFGLLLPARAQSPARQLDSLHRLLQNSQADSNRVRVLLSLVKWHQNSSNSSPAYVDTTLYYAEQAESLSRSLGFQSLWGETLLAKSSALLEARERRENARAEMRTVLAQALLLYRVRADTLRLADATFLMGTSYRTSDSTGLRYFRLALRFYQKLGNWPRAITTMTDMADVIRVQGKYAEVLRIYKAVLAIQEAKAMPARAIGETLSGLSTGYLQLGDYPKAVQYAYRSYWNAKKSGDAFNLESAYSNLAYAYGILGDNKKSLAYSYAQLRMSERLGMVQQIVRVRLNIIYKLLDLGQNQAALKQAEVIVKKTETEALTFHTSSLSALGYCYEALHNYPAAEKYYLQVMPSISEFSNGQAELCQALGRLYVKTNQAAKAAFYLSKAQKLTEQFGSPTGKREVALYLYRLDSIRRDYPAALIHFRHYSALNNTLVNEAKNKQLALLQIQFDTEKREQNIRLLTANGRRQQSELRQTQLARNSIIVGALLLLSLLYSRYRVKQRSNQQLEAKQLQINKQNHALEAVVMEKQGLLTEKEWLLKEIHHRVKNNLQIIISLLQSQGKYLLDGAAISAIEQSQHRVRAMALIHQKLYRSESLSRIDVPAYIREVVEQLRECFDPDERIRFRYNLAPLELDVSQAVPLGLIVNEAVTNALKYAFPPKYLRAGHGGTVELTLAAVDGENYRLVVADDGVGMPADVDLRQSHSMGANIMRGLSKQLGGALQVSSGPGVTISVPFALVHLQPNYAQTT